MLSILTPSGFLCLGQLGVSLKEVPWDLGFVESEETASNLSLLSVIHLGLWGRVASGSQGCWGSVLPRSDFIRGGQVRLQDVRGVLKIM